MARLRLTLLGGFDARVEPGRVLRVPLRKAQALLAYLAIPLGRTHRRDTLAALLWGGVSEAQARSGLRQTLFGLRSGCIPSDALRVDRETVTLIPANVESDVALFESRAEERVPGSLAEAADYYRGDLLAGLSLHEPPFEEWLFSERDRLRELALETLARLLAHHRESGATEAAVRTALQLLSLDPLQEAIHRTLMRLYLPLGRRGAALRQYQLCSDVLRRELRVEPEPETRELYREILRQHRAGPEGGQASKPDEAGRDGGRATPVTVASGQSDGLVGRDAEWARLREELDAAWAGNGRLVAVVGEAGVGKSRLLAEAWAHAERTGGGVLVGRGYETDQILAFGPWVDAFQSGRVAQDSETLRAISSTSQAALARLLPDAGTLTAQPADKADSIQLFHAVVQLIERLAAARTLLIALEDFHWADEMSLRLLAFIARRLAGKSILILVSVRSDDLIDAPFLERTLADLREGRHLSRMDLAPLARAATAELAHRLAAPGTPAALGQLDEQIWTATQGNPFMIVEMMQALRDGAVSPTTGVLPLPERVHALVSRRLSRLPEASGHLLALAAVLNRQTDFTLLHRAGGLGEIETGEAIEDLVRRGLLKSAGERFDIAHDRIRDVVYGQLSAPRRALLHRQVGTALEAVLGPDLEPYEVAVGTHYRQGEVWDKAAVFLRRAGDRAVARSAHREALACWTQTLGALARLPRTAERIELASRLRADLSLPLGQLGLFQAMLDNCREAEDLARARDDRLRLVQAYSALSFALASLGRLPPRPGSAVWRSRPAWPRTSPFSRRGRRSAWPTGTPGGATTMRPSSWLARPRKRSRVTPATRG